MFDVDRKALVIGGGLAGMTAALSIAHQGYAVYLVEREAGLGGNLRHIQIGEEGADPQALLHQTIAEVEAEPRIQVLTGSQVTSISGYPGHYASTVQGADGQNREFQHGVILVATGARQITPHEYLYGEHERVLTQRELEDPTAGTRFRRRAWKAATVVMIQCVGSREDAHPYCSRVCCTQALKNALAIKRQAPGAHGSWWLYRDLRSYGFREQLYRQARQAGVIFLEYSELKKPQVTHPVRRDNYWLSR